MATNVKLADVKVGKPRVPEKYSPEERRRVPVDPYASFIDRLDDKKYNYEAKTTTQSLFLRRARLANDADLYHRNYLEYLESCWADHLGIVITPDIVWFTLLSEVAGLVRENAEEYRSLFTRSQEKQRIVVDTEDPEVMPLNRLVAALRDCVPTDTTLFMPEFSTTSQQARHARYAAFADLCSPYYNYGMLLCAFPAIQVQGEEEDWVRMAGHWKSLHQTFSAIRSPEQERAEAWMGRVQATLERCADQSEDSRWWETMFKLERCGSGHQTEVSGWFRDLFRVQPKGPAYVQNFPTNVACVDYDEISKQREFRLQEGLFYSYQEGDFMVPDFGYTVHERLEQRVVAKHDDRGIEIERYTLPDAPESRKLEETWTVETRVGTEFAFMSDDPSESDES